MIGPAIPASSGRSVNSAMMLIFLLIFAFLSLAVVQQLERGQSEPLLTGCSCPGCGGQVELDWLICPRCKELLQVSCSGCEQRMPIFHQYCTACGTSRPASFGVIADDDQV